jgi:hypothetical protein
MPTITETIQRLQLGILLAQRMILKPLWQCPGYLVSGESTHRHGKEIHDLLERPLFGLWHEEENHYEYQDIEAPILGQQLSKSKHKINSRAQAKGINGLYDWGGEYGVSEFTTLNPKDVEGALK